MLKDLDKLDAAGVVAGAAACVQAEIAAGCQLLEYAAQWATLNPGDGLTFDERVEKYGEQKVLIAGDGTPDVAEWAIPVFGMEIRQNFYQARALIADALDLRHRLPRTWWLVKHARVPARVARRFAQQTRQLSKEQARIVDRRIARDLSNLSMGRLDNRVRAEILRIDRERAQREAEIANQSRYFRVSRPKPTGQCDVWARMPAPDAQQADSSVNRLADILITRKDELPDGVPARNAKAKDEWRSVAAAILLNNPVLATRLLLQDQQPDLFDVPTDDAPNIAPNDTAANHAPNHDVVTELIKRIDPTKLAPTATLHVHIDAQAFARDDLIARIEEVGPTLLSTVRTWLGEGCTVRLQPIIDSPGMQSVDRYEIPPQMREAVLARTPASAYPWSNSLNRKNQLDHTIPWRHGPTGIENLGPLTIAEHRFKTFGRAELRQPEPGTYVWRSAFGRVIITNATGTHDLGNDRFARTVWAAALICSPNGDGESSLDRKLNALVTMAA